MKNLILRIQSYFPSKKGKANSIEMRDFLKINPVTIKVSKHSDESGSYLMAVSETFNNKQIVTSGRNLAELEYNIKNAMFTLFDVPNYYSNYDVLVIPDLTKDLKLQYATN